jgi:hypothetical protein
MKTRVLYFIGCIIIIGFVSSCSSIRRLKSSSETGSLVKREYIEKLVSQTSEWECLTGKVALKLQNKEKTTKVNATLRLKKGEVIQLSMAPLLGIEVARLELSPDGALLLDRIHKRYVQLSFDDLSALIDTEVSFNVLQSLFFNELFLPGKSTLASSDLNRFRVIMEKGEAFLQAKDSKKLSYRFKISASEGVLQESRINMVDTPYGLNWKYDSFVPLEDRLFPKHMCLMVEGSKSPFRLDMNFSRLSVNSTWETHTDIPSKYKRTEIDELLKLLL